MGKIGRSLVRAVSLASALVAVGCDTEVWFSDSIDGTIDFAVTTDPEATLHAPYVVGATLELTAHGAIGSLSLVSSDPEVLELDAQGAHGHAIARSAGLAEVALVDADGDIVAAVDVEVRTPTRVVLHAAAPLFVDRADVPTEAGSLRVVEGGDAIFLVQYFDGATRLAGGGAVQASASAGLEVEIVPDFLGEHRDWLRLAALERGVQRVTLAIGGEEFTRMDVDVVDASAVADLDLFASESTDDPAGWGVVIASAYDLDGAPLYGVTFDWQLAAGAELVAPNLVRFTNAQAPAVLAARFGGFDGELELHDGHGAPAEGCTISRPAATPGLGLLLLILASRRRRARAGTFTSRSSPCETRSTRDGR